MLPVINSQPVEKVLHNPDRLEVHSVFETIQGEGPYAGTPSVFVRLAGCILACEKCDTDYTSQREVLTVPEIAERVLKFKVPKLVVLTGGEPLRQDVSKLCKALLSCGRRVQLETMGCDPVSTLPWGVYVVVSPKLNSVSPALFQNVVAYKYVLTAGEVSTEDGLPTTMLGSRHGVARPHSNFYGDVFVQPCDEGDESKNALNLKACIDSSMKFGHRLGLQLHKLLGVP